MAKWRPLLILIFLLALSLSAAWHFRDILLQAFQAGLAAFEKREALRDILLSMGALAPAGFILLQGLQVVLSPIPGEATGFIGGFLFGMPSFFYSTFGLTIGSLAAFGVSRKLRQFIKPVLERSPNYAKLEYLVEHQGLFITFLLFVLPGFPKDFLCYLLGLSRMPWQAFLLICAVGRLPGTLILTLQGANLYDGNTRGLLIIAAVTVIVLLPAWLLRHRIYIWMERHSIQ